MFYLLNMVIFQLALLNNHMVNIFLLRPEIRQIQGWICHLKKGSNGPVFRAVDCLCLKMGYTQEMAIT